jgi:hypothetical protein
MIENQTVQAEAENSVTFYNRRLREKRKKGHSLQMIGGYVLNAVDVLKKVSIDQLDLTPEELTEIERLRREEAERKERIRIEWEERARREQERARQELARRKAQVEAVEAKAKEAAADEIVPVDAAVYDELAALGIVLVSLSFRPGRVWWGFALGNDCKAKWKGGYQQYDYEVKDYRLRWSDENYQEAPDPLKKALQSAECVRAWLESNFPGSENTLLGTIVIHVPTRTAIFDYKHLRDMSDVAVLFDILAEHGVATVNIEFHAEDDRPVSDGVNFLDTDGEDLEIDIEDLADGCFEDAFEGHWKGYACEAIRGDTFRPRYAHAGDGDFFQDASGTVTFIILERKVSLSAIATVERVVEEEEDIEESWDVDKTETIEAA